MKKKIYFCVDYDTYKSYKFDTWISVFYLFSIDYCSTDEIINANRLDPWEGLVTTSIAHLSFDLIDKYDIYLCYKDKRVKIEEHMDLGNSGKDLRKEHNIFKIFRAGLFNYILGLEK